MQEWEEVAFLQLHNLVIETYQNRQAAMAYGAIDHIAIDVKNLDDLFLVVKEAGTFKMLDQQVNLKLWVKVKKDWRDSEFLMKNFGYREDE